VNTARVAEIGVPVLLLYPEDDPVFESSAQAEQEKLFLGADDVTTIFLPGLGHVPMLERRAEDLRLALSNWLRGRNLVSRGPGARE
jgi:pimeloyl-ACP methyl ester carboxylesterase